MIKIKMFNTREEEQASALAWAKETDVHVTCCSESLTIEGVADLEGYDGISLSQIKNLDKDLYPLLKKAGIKQIAQRSAGFDMYDLELARENGLIISNVPSYSPESIAEFTVMSALNLIRHVKTMNKRVSEKDFRWNPDFRGRVLGNMKVAIIGTGHIGYLTAKIFKGFGAEIYAYDLYPNEAYSDLLTYVSSVEEAVKHADIISLHVPATKENKHLFNMELFKKCKPGVMLLNMARGALVNTRDLLVAIEEGWVSSAALDTYEFEGPFVTKNFSNQPIENPEFLEVIATDRITYTPHVAFYTDEAITNLVQGGLQSALEVIQSGSTKNDVTASKTFG